MLGSTSKAATEWRTQVAKEAVEAALSVERIAEALDRVRPRWMPGDVHGVTVAAAALRAALSATADSEGWLAEHDAEVVAIAVRAERAVLGEFMSMRESKLKLAIATADDYVNKRGDAIAAHITLVSALGWQDDAPIRKYGSAVAALNAESGEA
jgi:hypothetical protein